jgi:magnesium transporter
MTDDNLTGETPPEDGTAEVNLLALRIDHTTFEDEAELDIVAEEVALYLRKGDFAAVKGFFVVQELADVASLLEHMDPEDSLLAMRQLTLPEQAEVFGYLRASAQISLADKMSREELAKLMAAMSHDERADLWKALDPRAREAVMPALARAEREDLRRLASYPEGTAGAIMTSDYATLRPDMTPSQALDALRRQASDAETVYTAYIVDERHKLLGVVSLRDILLARTRQTVADLMEPDPVVIAVDAEREEAATLIARYDLMALPVVDAEGRIVGIVTQDDAMDVAEQEATEDFYKGSTVAPIEEGVREASLFTLYKARIVWLVLLVFGNIFSGAGIAYFEETISTHLALLFFLPLLIASGGNAGAQSATLMVRALATGDARLSDWGRMLGREVVIALGLGVTMAFAVSWIGVWRGGVEIATVVAVSMVLIVLIGALIGLSLPFLFERFDRDPAAASGPLVTSITDVLGVLAYFGIATVILGLEAG